VLNFDSGRAVYKWLGKRRNSSLPIICLNLAPVKHEYVFVITCSAKEFAHRSYNYFSVCSVYQVVTRHSGRSLMV
jgi:hypothetical protein